MGGGRALTKRACTWLGPGAFPSALSRADRRSCMEYCWSWAHAPAGTWGMWRPRTAWKLGRSTGRMPYSFCEKARTAPITSWASVGSVWVLPYVPYARPTRGFYLFGSSNGLEPLDYILGVTAPEVLDGSFAVGREEGAEVADVLFKGVRLSLQLRLEIVLRGGVEL